MPTRRTPDRALGGAKERALQGVAERFGQVGGPRMVVRDEILGSWRRSADAGVQPDRLDPPFDGDLDDGGLLGWAAAAIIDRIAGDLAGTRTSLLLADQRAQIIARREVEPEIARLLDRIDLAPGFLYSEDLIGTNAIGTAIAICGPSNVQGSEHYATALIGMACAAMPILDPGTGRLLGILDLTSSAADASPLMTPLVKQAAWEIEKRLLDQFSDEDRALHETFLRARRSARGAIVAVSNHRLLVNTPAAAFVHPGDREQLWNVASVGGGEPISVTLANGRVVAIRSEAVLDAGRRVGSLIRFDSPDGEPGHVDGADGQPVATGWRSLSNAERAVATLVAEGLTNAETAARLYLSPHTVDFHLRHIFAKLQVGSRVEMTRIVVQQQGQANTPTG